MSPAPGTPAALSISVDVPFADISCQWSRARSVFVLALSPSGLQVQLPGCGPLSSPSLQPSVHPADGSHDSLHVCLFPRLGNGF